MDITHEYLVGQIQSTSRDVLSMMMGMEASCDDGTLNRVDNGSGLTLTEVLPGEKTVGESVEAFVGISGPMVGTGTICCDSQTACKLASAMLMSEITKVDGDVLDAIGEVANMIVGNLKVAIEERVGQLWLSVPSVVYGRNFTARTVGKFDWTVVEIALPEGKLTVKLCLTEAKKAPRNVASEAAVA